MPLRVPRSELGTDAAYCRISASGSLDWGVARLQATTFICRGSLAGTGREE